MAESADRDPKVHQNRYENAKRSSYQDYNHYHTCNGCNFRSHFASSLACCQLHNNDHKHQQLHHHMHRIGHSMQMITIRSH